MPIAAVGLVGAVLQLASPDGNYGLDAYRLAFASLAIPRASAGAVQAHAAASAVKPR